MKLNQYWAKSYVLVTLDIGHNHYSAIITTNSMPRIIRLDGLLSSLRTYLIKLLF